MIPLSIVVIIKINWKIGKKLETEDSKITYYFFHVYSEMEEAIRFGANRGEEWLSHRAKKLNLHRLGFKIKKIKKLFNLKMACPLKS